MIARWFSTVIKVVSSIEREGKFATLLNKVQLHEGVFSGGEIALSITTLDNKKREITPFYRHWGYVQAGRPIWEVELWLYSFSTTALEGVRGQDHAPADIYPGKTRYPLYRKLGGPQSPSGKVRKTSPSRDLIPGPSSPQPVAIVTTLPGPQNGCKSLLLKVIVPFYILIHPTTQKKILKFFTRNCNSNINRA